MRTGSALAALRQFARVPPSAAETCEACGEALPPSHDHRLQLETGKLSCVCQVCAAARSGGPDSWKYVGHRLVSLDDVVGESDWKRFNLPIDLAYFVTRNAVGRTEAFFPSPMGATEAAIDAEAWAALLARSPILGAMQPDVEALLVHRTQLGVRRAHLVSIDVCYRLIGTLRQSWRGFSGGPEVWGEIERFMAASIRDGS